MAARRSGCSRPSTRSERFAASSPTRCRVRHLIERIVEAATKAPSGGNSQPWGFVVVQDRTMLDQLAVYAREGFEAMYQAARPDAAR